MQAGWYSDPTGDHEFRYHNGRDWTGDVATDGVRHVTEVPDLSTQRFPQRRDPRSGTVAMVFGIISMTIGWIPFVCFVAVVFAAVAIIVGYRRRKFESARGSAIVGIVTGSVGLLLCLAGMWLSVVLVRAVADFEDPGPHEAELTACDEADGITQASGTITNLDDRERSYTISIEINGDSSIDAVVDDVGPGEQRIFRAEEDLRFTELECSIAEVNGPRPFGIEQ